jgi:hypothetical protein
MMCLLSLVVFIYLKYTYSIVCLFINQFLQLHLEVMIFKFTFSTKFLILWDVSRMNSACRKQGEQRTENVLDWNDNLHYTFFYHLRTCYPNVL